MLTIFLVCLDQEMFSRFCTADKRKYEFSFQFKREGCFFPDSYYLITSRQDAQICIHLMLMKARLSRRRALKAGIVPFFDKWSFAFFTCLVIKRQKPEMKALICEMKFSLSERSELIRINFHLVFCWEICAQTCKIAR